jgi:hypothetical protein
MGSCRWWHGGRKEIALPDEPECAICVHRRIRARECVPKKV